MAGMQETDHITLKNGITYLLQDAKARAKLAELLVEVMEKYGADNPPPYPVTSVNGQTGDVTVQGGSGSGIAIQDDEPTDGELVWIDTDDPGTTHIIPEIDDTQESAVDTWSSQKIASEIAGANDSGASYCKMPDGTLICWGDFSTETLTANAAWGSLYETPAVSVSVAFPVRFAVTPCVWYRCRTTRAQCMLEDATIVSTTGIGGSIYLYRPTSATVAAFVQWLAIGRWK